MSAADVTAFGPFSTYLPSQRNEISPERRCYLPTRTPYPAVRPPSYLPTPSYLLCNRQTSRRSLKTTTASAYASNEHRALPLNSSCKMAEMTFYVGMPDAEMHAILEASCGVKDCTITARKGCRN